MSETVTVIGAGLAGSETAWQLAQRGVKVRLYEMRPHKSTPAHHTADFGELVCSNSLRGAGLETGPGLLKEEMRRLNSLIMACADMHQVPAGGALAVDREGFAREITTKIKAHPLIEVVHDEVTVIPEDGITVIATGPLTSENMSSAIKAYLGEDYFYFYDAAAPIVSYESLNLEKVYRASRYGKGDEDYLNCPMNKEEYEAFFEALTTAETAPIKEFEQEKFFEGCMPIEVMAKRGPKTLLFGPLKPVGLIDPRTNERPHAVVQLRQDNKEGTLFNIVGFQTHLKWSEQKRVFSMIPGLEAAEFVRFGVMHRNTFIKSPNLLLPTYQSRKEPRVFFAGQITGVEGYVESAASGLVAGINAARYATGLDPLVFPKETAHGALANYITTSVAKSFQPMNINFGILPEVEGQRIRDKKLKKITLANKALTVLDQFIAQNLS